MTLVYILLALALVRWIVIYKVYHSVPEPELKRRARAHDRRFAGLHKVASYQPALDVLLWMLGTAAGTVLFIWSARTGWIITLAAIILSSWLLVWGRFTAEGWAGGVAAFFAPFDSRVLSILHPVLAPLAKIMSPARRVYVHTGLYEKRDLLEFIKKQNEQSDNRIPEPDLLIAFNAMQFGDKKVGQVMTPRRQVKMVSADELAGPILTDELHKTGFSRFPVVADSTRAASPKIIGTLYLSDLIGHQGSGKVKDLAHKEVFFINEDSNLRQALNAFLKSHHHLLIVVNSFEEMAGVLSLEDVLEQILGKQIVDEFDNYENLRAVAAQDAKQEHAEHKETHPVQAEEPEPASS